MASRKLVFIFVLSYLLSHATSSSYDDDGGARIWSSSASGSYNVDLSLYYETLCPYCADFIVTHLVKVFEKGLITIVNLRLIPWGNAVVKSDNTFECQHGPDECMLNTVEACAINAWPDLNKHFSAIYCIERLALEGNYSQWESCFRKPGFGNAPIDCYRSGNGKALELQYAKETAHLNPPHTYVPWVTVNNRPLGDDYQNFVTYVCKAYKGPAVPKACTSLPHKINSSEKRNPIHQVCYPGEAKNLTSLTPAKKMPGSVKASRTRRLKMETPV